MTLDTTPQETPRPTDTPALTARIRWAGIVWGLFFSALSVAALWIVGSAERRDDVAEWYSQLTGPTVAGVAVLALGALLLVAGLVGLLRRAQKSLTPSSEL